MSTEAATPGFVLDLGRCVGCAACVLACRLENAGRDRRSPALRRVVPLNERRHPGGPTWFLSLACHHCERPACVRACPSGAYERRADGIVLHDDALCVGCRYCEMACPFGAPQFDAAAGVMAKCDFCHARVAEGEPPACVAACPTEALTGSGLNTPIADLLDASVTGGLGPDPDSAACRPAIRFKVPRGLRGDRLQRLIEGLDVRSAQGQNFTRARTGLHPAPDQNFRRAFGTFHEWPLVLFTALAIPAAGVFAARLIAALLSGGIAPADRVHAVAALALLVGLASSLAHLGRPSRAPLALRRTVRSALSTEVALAAALLVLVALSLLPSASPALRVALSGAAGVLALGLLATLGFVYSTLPARWPWRTTLVATPITAGLALGAAVSTGAPWGAGMAVGLLSVDLLAFAAPWLSLRLRPLSFRRAALAPVHPGVFARRLPLVALRLLLVNLVPATLLLGHLPLPAVAVLAAGLFVDRFAFYGLVMAGSPEAEISRIERRIAALRP